MKNRKLVMLANILLTIILLALPITAEGRNHLPINKYKDPTPKEEVVIIALQEGYEPIGELLDLIWCESRFDPNATHYNGTHSNGTYSEDRGILQINSFWHSEVSDRCSYNIRCSVEWGIWMLRQGRGYEWVCYDIIH